MTKLQKLADRAAGTGTEEPATQEIPVVQALSRFPKCLLVSLDPHREKDDEIKGWRITLAGYHSHVCDLNPDSDSEHVVACQAYGRTPAEVFGKLLVLPVREGNNCSPSCSLFEAGRDRI